MLEYITSDPAVLGGKPCVKGTRISVEFILELYSSGATIDDILSAYPQLTAKGIQEALHERLGRLDPRQIAAWRR